MKRVYLLAVAGLLISSVTFAQEQPPRGDRPPKEPMNEQDRAQLEQRVDEAWAKLPVREKVQLMRFHRALRSMPPEERNFIRDRLERFVNMPPEEREKLKQNRERWLQMSPEERQRAREEFRKRRQDFEEKWRQEHPGEEPPPFLRRGPKGEHDDQPPPTEP